MADHDNHILRTAFRALAFLLSEIGTQSDRGWSDVASCSHEGLPDIRRILGNLDLKVISALHSKSRQRKDNASVTLDHAALPPGPFGPSSIDVYIYSASFVTSLSGAVHCQRPIPSHIGCYGKHDNCRS